VEDLLTSESEPAATVVVASLVGAPFIDDCLASLEDQVRRLGAEAIVVACGSADYAEGIARRFPWVLVIHRERRESVPALRAHGVRAARAKLVAIVEEHCLAAPDWLERALEAHASGAYGAAGGPVADRGYRRLRDWVVYFCEYNGYLPPWPEGDTTHLGSANIAYRREVLQQYSDSLGEGYWEGALHARMLADGVRFRSAPRMLVYHRGPFDFGYYLRQRFWFSRAFAGSRNLPASRKLLYLAIAPLVPFLLLARMARRVAGQRCHPMRFVLTLPLLAPALLVYVAGEVAGYAAGPGDALLKVE
jgi:glycosyltransferase involved in cell wall biosynthesis